MLSNLVWWLIMVYLILSEIVLGMQRLVCFKPSECVFCVFSLFDRYQTDPGNSITHLWQREATLSLWSVVYHEQFPHQPAEVGFKQPQGWYSSSSSYVCVCVCVCVFFLACFLFMCLFVPLRKVVKNQLISKVLLAPSLAPPNNWNC